MVLFKEKRNHEKHPTLDASSSDKSISVNLFDANTSKFVDSKIYRYKKSPHKNRAISKGSQSTTFPKKSLKQCID